MAQRARAVFVPAAIAGFASFAALGLATSVTSGILAEVLGLTDRALTGGVVFTLFAASALAQVLLRGAAIAFSAVVALLGVAALAAQVLVERRQDRARAAA